MDLWYKKRDLEEVSLAREKNFHLSPSNSAGFGVEKKKEVKNKSCSEGTAPRENGKKAR